MRLLILLALGVACAWAPNTTAAQSTIDPDASVVALRSPSSIDCPSCTGCETTPGNFLDNCFETTVALTDWLWVDAGTPSGRANEPSSLDYVFVDVGPGTFDPFVCEGQGARGFVSLEGAGRDATRFIADQEVFYPGIGACQGGVTALGCTSLSFRNITVGTDAGTLWTGAGDSLWQDVDMFAENEDGAGCFTAAFAWYDASSAGGLHFFWNTRFDAAGPNSAVNAFRNNAAEAWFYGCDFLARQIGSPNGTPRAIVSASTDGVRIFGSTVRGRGNVIGIEAAGGGEVHMHGGIISLDGLGGPVLGIWTTGASAFVHTPDTAFALKGSQKVRLLDTAGGTIQSPFLWPRGTTPPDITSITGADLFVKTNEGPGQDEPHLLVYDSACTPDPWRRVADNTCL